MLSLPSFWEWLWTWNWYLISSFLVGAFKYVRLIRNCQAVFWEYRPTNPPDDSSFTCRDVTAILATITEDVDELWETVESLYRIEPAQIIIVTADSCLKRICGMVDRLYSSDRIKVMSISKANKRRQMCHAFPEVKTKFILLVDDDVLLPPKFMPWALAPFENPQIGGVGTCQRLRRKRNPNTFDFLGALYLERRNFDCGACNWIDGAVPCLSGRAVMYRSCILQDPGFTYDFTHETFLTYQLNADDDNFITRRLMEHKWKIKFQWHRECEVQTTLEGNWKFLKQCLRWVRSNWRSNLTSMFVERNVWRQYPWSSYAVFQTTITAWALPYDLSLFYLFHKGTSTTWWLENSQYWTCAWVVFLLIWFTSKFIKLLGHYLRYPVDVLLIPLSILFGWLHGGIKAYGLCTLWETTWGSRDGADTDDACRMIRLSPPKMSEV